MTIRKLLGAACATAALALAATLPAASQASDKAAATPRYSDGAVRFDRMPNEKGYWDNPTASSLVEEGKKVEMDKSGRLKNIADAKNVAPFQPWALALYEHRQKNNFADDPMKVCIGPGNPRMMHWGGGMRILQDRNYKRAYIVFGGGNHGWRTIYMDGREPPNPDEVTINDPRTYTRPWKSSWDFHWVAGDVPTQFCEDGRK